MNITEKDLKIILFSKYIPDRTEKILRCFDTYDGLDVTLILDDYPENIVNKYNQKYQVISKTSISDNKIINIKFNRTLAMRTGLLTNKPYVGIFDDDISYNKESINWDLQSHIYNISNALRHGGIHHKYSEFTYSGRVLMTPEIISKIVDLYETIDDYSDDVLTYLLAHESGYDIGKITTRHFTRRLRLPSSWNSNSDLINFKLTNMNYCKSGVRFFDNKFKFRK